MMKAKTYLLISISILLLVGVIYAEATAPKVSYSYKLSSEGYIYAAIFIDNLEDQYIIYVKVEESIVEESLVAINEFNDLLPAELVDSNLILIYNVYNSRKVIVSYVARAANISGTHIDVVITPGGPSKILLPRSSALLYFNGSAGISFTDTTITLTYDDGGTYLISYIPLTFVSNLTTPTTNKTAEQTYWLQLLTPYLLGASLISLGLAYYILRHYRTAHPKVREEGVELPEYDVETLRSEVDERDIEVLKAIVAKELTISGLARELRLSKSVVWRRIRKLSHLKLITTTDVNGKTYIKVTSLGMKVLEEASRKP